MKKILCHMILLSILLFYMPMNTKAEVSEQDIYGLLQEAFEAQLILTNDYRTMEEVKAILQPYFTPEYAKVFLDEHLFEEDEGFIVYGTDVLDYVIPFFSYNSYTKVQQANDMIIVSEYFTQITEGPVVADGHYQSIVLTYQDDKWLVSDYIISEEIPTMKEAHFRLKNGSLTKER